VRILAAIALLLVAGCGEQGPTPEEQVRAKVVEFGRATADKDYQAICDRILAAALIERLKRIGLPCEVALQQSLGEVRDPRLTIGRVDVQGESASAQVRTSATGQEPSEDTMRLVNENGTWKISSLGS
jgi:predicted small lipoprotein YifL